MMACLAQMTPRHRRVDALGPRVCIARCSYMHFAMYAMHLPAPEDQSSGGAACSPRRLHDVLLA